MIRIETLDVQGFYPALHGMRSPYMSWDGSDSIFTAEEYPTLGQNDRRLALTLAKGGPVNAKYRRMITVWADITAPLYWWKEFDTYKVGTVANSSSTMHTIHKREFTFDDFSHEHLLDNRTPQSLSVLTDTLGGETAYKASPMGALGILIDCLNNYRKRYLETNDRQWWWQMIQLLPSSYNQTRTVQLNYEVLANICRWRSGHKLDEWRQFVSWAKELPYAELFEEKEESGSFGPKEGNP